MPVEISKDDAAIPPSADHSIRESIARILSSETFRRSPQLKSFLSYVCECALKGSAALSEYEIGTAALGRPRGYSPNEDNIVRVQARSLRLKLAKYYLEEGKDAALRVVLPKGSYLPHFATAPETAPTAFALSGPVSEIPPPESPVRARRNLWTVAACAALLLAAIFAGARIKGGSVSDRFWKQALPPKQNVLFVPTDASLVVMQEVWGKIVPLSQYAGRDYWHDYPAQTPAAPAREAFGKSSLVTELGSRRLTSLTSLKALVLAMRRASATEANIVPVYARESRADVLDHENLFLVGAPHSNPWIELFSSQSGFYFEYPGNIWRVRVRYPGKGEPTEFVAPVKRDSDRTYGLISFLPNRTKGKSVLMVQGTGSSGTEAALDFLSSETRLADFLTGVSSTGQVPYFEVLLESTSVAGTAPGARVVAWRRH